MSVEFSYSISTCIVTRNNEVLENEISLREEFIPYNKKECLNIYYNHNHSVDLRLLIESFDDIDNNTADNNELGYVLMDAICFISVFTGKIWGLDNYKFRKYEIDFFEYYKLFLQEIRFDYSIISNCQNIISKIETNNKLKEITISYLEDINKNYYFQNDKNDTLKNQFSFMLNQLNNFYNHKINVHLSNNQVNIVNNFIKQLQQQNLSSNFFYKNKKKYNCFAIAFKKQFYYAISGYDYIKQDKRFETIQELLLPYISSYCYTKENTRSYGYIDNTTGSFVKYEKYITHENGKNPEIKNLFAQFSCCERKILSEIDKETTLHKLKFICKYKPCIDCSLALLDATNEYYHGIDFKYYYLDSHEFAANKEFTKEYIKNNTNNNSISIRIIDK